MPSEVPNGKIVRLTRSSFFVGIYVNVSFQLMTTWPCGNWKVTLNVAFV